LDLMPIIQDKHDARAEAARLALGTERDRERLIRAAYLRRTELEGELMTTQLGGDVRQVAAAQGRLDSANAEIERLEALRNRRPANPAGLIAAADEARISDLINLIDAFPNTEARRKLGRLASALHSRDSRAADPEGCAELRHMARVVAGEVRMGWAA
jgi:hypothetical protein